MLSFLRGSLDTAGLAFCRVAQVYRVLFSHSADTRGKNSHGTQTLSEMMVQTHLPEFLKGSTRRRDHMWRGEYGSPDVFLLFRAIHCIVVMFLLNC